MAADSTPFGPIESGVGGAGSKAGSWPLVLGYFVFTIVSTVVLLALNVWLFTRRWELTGRG